MNHDQKKAWMGRLYALYGVWAMRIEDIFKFGDPWQIAKAQTLEEPKVRWIGGEGDCNSTLDVELLLESQSGREDYSSIYKLGPSEEESFLELVNPCNYPKHFCKYEGYENGISRLPGPCKHRIRGRMFLEENLKDISGLKMNRAYGYYDDPRRFWVRKKYNREIMAYYKYLAESRTDLDSIQKRDRLYKFLFYDWKINKRV